MELSSKHCIKVSSVWRRGLCLCFLVLIATALAVAYAMFGCGAASGVEYGQYGDPNFVRRCRSWDRRTGNEGLNEGCTIDGFSLKCVKAKLTCYTQT